MSRSDEIYDRAVEHGSRITRQGYCAGTFEEAAFALADYAAALEQALGGTVPTPWDPPAPRLDPDPIDVAEERERAYERQCKREGVEP